MKFKFYAAALAAMAMAACNNEEMLEVNNPSVGSSNVVFGLAMDEDATRAQFAGSKGYTLQWMKEHADKMSLFHSFAYDGSGSIMGAQNAVYTAAEADENGRPVFFTQNMVNKGLAVMVYPCDTIFTYQGWDLLVKVPAQQTKETNLLIPFISNALQIAAFEAGATDGAGFARKYDIAMKQVGTLFTLTTNWSGENFAAIEKLAQDGEIEPLELTSVDVNIDGNAFATASVIKTKATAPKSQNAGRDKYERETQAYPLTSATFKTNKISTTDILEKKTSEFVLLPHASGANLSTDVKDDNTTNVVVNTNYGTVTLASAPAEKVWWKDGDMTDGVQNYYSIAEGLKTALELTYNIKVDDATKTFFPGEQVGGHVARFINCDLATIDMSTVHIKDNDQLLDMIAVHDKIQPNTEVVFTLDGDENGVFEMPVSTVNILNAQNKITIKACDTPKEALGTIKLTGSTEVPSIKFMAAGSPIVNIELANEEKSWKWSTGAKKFTKVKNITNNGLLLIEAGAVVEANIAGKMINDNTVKVTGDANQKTNFVNNGELYIASGALYSVDAVTFVNEAKSATEQAYIRNRGEFGVINGGVINNYGLIQQGNATSKTFITSNQEGGIIANAFSNTNKMGTILLYNVNDNRYSISDVANQGFIKIQTTAAEVNKSHVGVEANFVEITGDCTALNTEDFPERVKYIQINSNKEVEWTATAAVFEGLIVNEGCKLYLPKANKATIGVALVKGRIYRGGTLTISSYVSYFGGATTDKANVLTY